MAHLHDSGYKYLFSHAELVQELLEAFAPPGVSALLDYTTLRLENGNIKRKVPKSITPENPKMII